MRVFLVPYLYLASFLCQVICLILVESQFSKFRMLGSDLINLMLWQLIRFNCLFEVRLLCSFSVHKFPCKFIVPIHNFDQCLKYFDQCLDSIYIFFFLMLFVVVLFLIDLCSYSSGYFNTDLCSHRHYIWYCNIRGLDEQFCSI